MYLSKSIEIDGLPLVYHRIQTIEVDVELAVVVLRVQSWFSKEAAEAGIPPHRAHLITSHGEASELAAVLLRGLNAGILAGAEVVAPQAE